MKTIRITGKNNIDQMSVERGKASRASAKYKEPSHNEQVEIVNKFYMEHSDSMENEVSQEIARKIRGYKSQDVKKQIFDEKQLVTRENVIEKLVTSRLRCHYCRGKVKVLFTGVRDRQQWTLDRLDNDLCHSASNTVICCLKCNLERRILDADKFTFTKQLKITKSDSK